MLRRLSEGIFFRKLIDFLSSMSSLARVADGILLALSLYVIYLIRDEYWGHLQTLTWVIATILFTIIGEFSGVYRSYREESLSSRIGRVCSVWALTVAGLLMIAFVTKTSESFSRAASLSWFLLAPATVSAWHTTVGMLVRMARTKGHNTRKAAIVGITDMSTHLAENIKAKPWMGVDIMGYFEDRNVERLPDMHETIGPYLGNYDKLVEMARSGEIDMVYISLPMRAELRINKLIGRLGVTTTSIYLAQSFGGFNLLPPNCAPRWNRMGDVSVLGVVESPFSGLLGAVKQLEDMLLGTILLALTALPMAVIAVTIKLTSKGPVFFRQTRYGLNGKKIEVLKFRTMTVCENGHDVKQATKNDNRVTKVGAFLRRTSLDELPQFFHVVTGKMSIVGPRPHAVAHNEQYRELIDYYMVRHKVKPGITGWAQVNGWRGETDTDEKMAKRVEYDLVYIKNWTLLFDLKIIFMTIFGSKTHNNAY